MSYSSSRHSSSSSKSGSWKRRSSGVSENRAQSTPNKKSPKDATPDLKQRAITSYFGAKPPSSPFLPKSNSSIASVKHNGLHVSSQSPKPASASESTQSSLESTQVITILDDESNDETDSQATVVVEELEPLMSQLLEESQHGSASSLALYYTDEIDDMLQYYDIDAALSLHRFKQAPQAENESQEASSVPTASSEPSYHLSNFMAILRVVEEKDSHLFSSEEKAVMRELRGSTVDEQRLFSRLLYRKGPWFQTSKLEYADISDMKKTLVGLIAAGVLEEPSGVLDVLPALSNTQLRQLTRSSSSLKREQLLSVASKWVSTQRTVDGRAIKIPKEIGQCVRIREFVDILFKRVHRLFFLNQVEDQSTLIMIHTGQLKFPTYLIPSRESKKEHKDRWVHDSVCSYELSTSFTRDEDVGPTPPGSPNSSQRDLKDFLFPSTENSGFSSMRASEELENVAILRSVGFHSVFKNRIDLDEYEDALAMSHNLMQLLGSDIDVDNDTTDNHKRAKQMPNVRNLNDPAILAAAMRLVEDAVFKYQLKKSELDANDGRSIDEDPNLPLGSHLFLKRFTAMWVYTSIIWVGVSLLERQKKYKEAITYLKLLLDQFEVNRGRRGDWWIRLIFDVSHLKETEHAVELCCTAIQDENCRPQHLLKLYDKLRILIKTKLRETAKDEKEVEKRRKADERLRKKRRKGDNEEDEVEFKSPPRIKKAASAIIELDEDEEEHVPPKPMETPKKSTRPKRGSRAKVSASASPEPDTDLTSPVPSTPSTASPSSPTSPTVRQEAKERRGNLAVPIPLPGDDFLAATQEILPAAPKVEIDKVIPGRSRNASPDHPLSPPALRYTSPIRYRSPERSMSSSPAASPLSPVKAENGRLSSAILDFDLADYDEEEIEAIAEIPPEILEEMKALSVPLPQKLNEGTIETIYGKKQTLANSPSGWGNKSVFVGADGSHVGVEEYSLQHYKQNGWTKGQHCEGTRLDFRAFEQHLKCEPSSFEQRTLTDPLNPMLEPSRQRFLCAFHFAVLGHHLRLHDPLCLPNALSRRSPRHDDGHVLHIAQEGH